MGRVTLGGGVSGKYGYFEPRGAAAAAAADGGGVSGGLARLPWPLSALRLADVCVPSALYKAHASWQSAPDGGPAGATAAFACAASKEVKSPARRMKYRESHKPEDGRTNKKSNK